MTFPFEDGRGEDRGLDIVAVLEAMMFASTEPLSLEEIRVALPEVDPAQIEHGLDALARALDRPERGLRLEKVAGGYRLVTRPELVSSLRALFRFRNQKRLTPAALDVLAIVAYAQPITAPEMQEIRGTDPAYALKTLMERRLVRMVGRKRVVGRPILYGTTRDFLLHFGLDSLEDLPPVEGFGTRVVPAQGRLFPVTAGEGSDDIEPLGDLDENEVPGPGPGTPAPGGAGEAAAGDSVGQDDAGTDEATGEGEPDTDGRTDDPRTGSVGGGDDTGAYDRDLAAAARRPAE